MMKSTPAECWYVLAAVLVIGGDVHATRAAVAGREAIDVPIVFSQLPADSPATRQPAPTRQMLRCDYGEGGQIVRLDPDGQLRILTEGFAAACECDVSFDGRRILFAGKRNARDRWDVWEMNADGSSVRQITRGLGNCRHPIYLATLYFLDDKPTYQIAFASDAPGVMNESGSRPLTNVYACHLDGNGARRLTFNLSNDMDPVAMSDGRILLASWQRMGLERGLAGRVALFAVHTDGADYALLCGDQGRRVKTMPCVMTDGWVVFVEADDAVWDGAGQLASVSLRRSLYSHRRITNDGQYLYHSPSPLPGGRELLVSRRPADGSGNHAICRLDLYTGKAEPVHDDSRLHDFHAKALAPRPEPDGRSTSVNEKFASGKLYCLNVNTTKPALTPHMRPGMVRRLRVIEGVPMRQPEGAASKPADTTGGSERRLNPAGLVPVVPKRFLGDIPVEADGSFHIELPADVPVQLQTLDENGMALQSCGWIWAKPREWRGCIGCHEDRERVPENEFVLAVRRPAINLMLPEDKRRTVDFQRDLMPVIARSCATASCHGGGAAPDLTSRPSGPFNKAYTSLLTGLSSPKNDGQPVKGRYVHPGQARTSPLIWRLYGRNTSRPWDATYGASGGPVASCPPPHAAQLTDEEKGVFVEWIDLGALWSGPGTVPILPAEARGSDSRRAARWDTPRGNGDRPPLFGAGETITQAGVAK